MPVSLNDLEEIGSAEIGIGVQSAVQTPGGGTNLVIKRRFKVSTQVYTQYLFQILNPVSYIKDKKYNGASSTTPAYLVKQWTEGLDKANADLFCMFAMVPSTYNEYDSQTISLPGVQKSSLYDPSEFLFRNSSITKRTQVRIEHAYFLGNPQGIATYEEFNVMDSSGVRTNLVTDNTDPSADEYISMVNGSQEIVIESPVKPWMGDIWERRTVFALAL
jgi:hypothetical protein